MKYIPVASPVIKEEEARAVYDVVKSGWISMGRKVKEFENMVCEYTGSRHSIAMNNGTSTLHAILMALDIGPGDEVIIPTLTYISSANVVLYQGATPVFCDNDPLTYNVTAESIREKISSNTKAIMTVDMKGLPVDFDSFKELSAETGIPFISDSAESYGSIYKGSFVGSQATAHSFSFFANKNITTGEGGIVTTNDLELFKKLRIIRNQGQEGRYNHTLLGNNYRMTDILAALGVEQLKRIDTILEKKVSIASFYSEEIGKIDGIRTPYVPSYVGRPSWYNYSINLSPARRDKLLKYFEKNQIETRLSFPPIHIQPFYSKKFGLKANEFKEAIRCFQTFVDIPIWAEMKQADQSRIVSLLKKFMSEESVL